MLQHQGVYLPDGERHMVEWMTKNGELVDGRGSYQIRKLRAALHYCKSFRTAVDIGAHCGLWSMQLQKRFRRVDAFEPVADHRECFMANVPNAEEDAMQNVYLHACALGDHDGNVSMVTPEEHSSGSTMIDRGKSGDIPLRTMDIFLLRDVDFIKLDCEGAELFALRGGELTIKRDHPVIIVEQKPGRAQRFGLPETGAVDYLKSLGYMQAECLSGDYIMVPV